MTGLIQSRFGNHVPDILDCLAQLSNDEVPTPPKIARSMLELLPPAVWSNSHYKWLDPCCKSGVFLREIAARLLVGLAEWEPDFAKRRDHILLNDRANRSQRDEQRGVALLMKGVFAAFRNPAAHEPKIVWTMTEQDALDVLGTLSMVHRRLDAARLSGR